MWLMLSLEFGWRTLGLKLSWSMHGHILYERTIIELTESPMMATLSIVQYQPLPPSNLIRPVSDLRQNSSPISLPSKTIILIISITNQQHTTSAAAHIEPHRLHTRSMLQEYHATHHTCSRGHEFWPPYGIPRI